MVLQELLLMMEKFMKGNLKMGKEMDV